MSNKYLEKIASSRFVKQILKNPTQLKRVLDIAEAHEYLPPPASLQDIKGMVKKYGLPYQQKKPFVIDYEGRAKNALMMGKHPSKVTADVEANFQNNYHGLYASDAETSKALDLSTKYTGIVNRHKFRREHPGLFELVSTDTLNKDKEYW